MIARTSTSGLTYFPAERCRLPVHSLSTQTRHILDNQKVDFQRSQKMLYLFALVLSLALATVLCLLITTTPVSAMPIPPQPQANPTGGLVALGAILSLGASAGVGIALITAHFGTFRKR